MLFNSLHFLVFFPVVTLVYFLLPFSWRWAWLLIASCYFYMALIPVYILILVALILVDYAAALAMERCSGWKRKWILLLSLLSNIGMLGVFKYFNFFNANLAALARALDWRYPVQNLSLVLPIGLSFHTFQSMSYTIEVYRGRQKAERHLGIYALYVMFYPQLVAGPIERPEHLLHQFRRPHAVQRARILSGLKLMLIGFFKKVAVADTLAISVNAVYHDPARYGPGALAAAAYFFAFQILYDFAGYSDIARGAAQVMGFELMVNFNRPYAARTIGEFWRRWHISLSSWFRDYLYIPLGGSRVNRLAYYRNILVVFLVSGLWHGANWTFVAWGAVHGVCMVLGEAAQGAARRVKALLSFAPLYNALTTALTFHIVALAWIFFRAASLSQAVLIIQRLFSPAPADAMSLPGATMAISWLLIGTTELAGWLRRRPNLSRWLPSAPVARHSLSYAWAMALIGIILLRVSYDTTPQQFIYFQF